MYVTRHCDGSSAIRMEEEQRLQALRESILSELVCLCTNPLKLGCGTCREGCRPLSRRLG